MQRGAQGWRSRQSGSLLWRLRDGDRSLGRPQHDVHPSAVGHKEDGAVEVCVSGASEA